MASVAAIYWAKKLSSRYMLKAYTLCACALGVAAFTSMPNVMANFFHAEGRGLPSLTAFLLTAVEKTNLGIQAALLIATLVIASLVVDAFVSSRKAQFA